MKGSAQAERNDSGLGIKSVCIKVRLAVEEEEALFFVFLLVFFLI